MDLEELLARVAREIFGLSGPTTLLPGDRDLNARVGDAVVKICAEGTDPRTLALQDAALDHLAHSPAAHLVPGVLSPVTDPWVVVGGVRRPVRALEWLDGPLFWDVPHPDPVLLRSLGRAVAEVDRALSELRQVAAGPRSAWHPLDAAGLVTYLPALSDLAKRSLVAMVLQDFATSLAPVLAGLPDQLIHGDVNDHNVVVADEGQVLGLIDFGDLMTAPRVCDLAIAAAYATLHQQEPVSGIHHVVAGYQEVVPLTAAELVVVEPLVRTRLATSLVMQAHERTRQPDNDYLLVSQEDAWRVLQLLVGT